MLLEGANLQPFSSEERASLSGLDRFQGTLKV